MAPPFLTSEAQFPLYKKAMQALLVDQGLWDAVITPVHRSVRSMIGAVNDGRSDLRSAADGLREERSVATSSTSATRVNSRIEVTANRAYLMLIMSLSKSPEAQAIVYDVPQGNAHELWSRLVGHFEQLTEMSKSFLLAEFSALRMKGGESVALYAARVKRVVMSLAAAYHSHCVHLIECIRYMKLKQFFSTHATFLANLSEGELALFTDPCMAKWIEESDWATYQVSSFLQC